MSGENESDRYPEVSDDAELGDQVMALLGESHESHIQKAIVCVLMAKRELQFANEDGETPTTQSIGEFAEAADQQLGAYLSETDRRDRS